MVGGVARTSIAIGDAQNDAKALFYDTELRMVVIIPKREKAMREHTIAQVLAVPSNMEVDEASAVLFEKPAANTNAPVTVKPGGAR
jgi:hypothetical protein